MLKYQLESKGCKLSFIANLPLFDYFVLISIIEKLDDLEDIRLYDEVKKEDSSEHISMEEAFKVIRLKVTMKPELLIFLNFSKRAVKAS